MAFTREDLQKRGRLKVIETMKDGLIQNDKDLVKVASLSIGEVEEVDIDNCTPFPEHTYESYDEAKMKELEKSIKLCGLQTPIILWDNGNSDNKYVILAGHNRLKACKNVGYKKIPAIIKKDLSYNEAAIIVNQTNMVQRSFEGLSIYEKCSSIYQMKKAKEEFEKEHPEKKEADENVSKERKDGIRSISREFGVSKSLVSSYLLLYEMLPKKAFKYMEDTENKKKLFDTNVALIFCKLPKGEIKNLIKYLDENEDIKKINRAQAKDLVAIYNQNNKLENKDYNKALVFNEKKKKENKPITFNRETFKKYFDINTSDEDIMNEIINLLEEKRKAG